jgi:hypothetical protein
VSGPATLKTGSAVPARTTTICDTSSVGLLSRCTAPGSGRDTGQPTTTPTASGTLDQLLSWGNEDLTALELA